MSDKKHFTVVETTAQNMNTSEMMVHELIAFQAKLTPHKIAIQFDDQEVSYGELLSRANQVANYLRARGVRDGCRVAIFMNRSIDMVSGILGCLIAGGAYIPIDTSYPKERVCSIIEDSQSNYIITHANLSDSLGFPKDSVICLDILSNTLAEQPSVEPENLTSLDNPAYIIYTSGSTGKPKGVVISHRSLRNFIRISQSVLDVFPDDIYLQSASISYAVAVRQLMVPLSQGASLIVATNDQMHDPLMLLEEIKRKHITLVDVVPSFWRAIVNRLRDLPKTELSELMDNDLRRIVSVGEALPLDIPADWVSITQHPAKLVNIFGQTETTGIVSAYPIPVELNNQNSSTVPIGKSIAETALYILDNHLQLVEDGHIGELCISNPCLATEYLNLPELTAEKFIPNPFADGYSDRLYRTGDTARRNPDGTIVFLGRGDTQIKIRGHRVDLGDIESCIRKFQGVQECVVLGNQPDNEYLTAYILFQGEQIETTDLKHHCRRWLPEFMLPSNIVILDKLPLLPNGKVDRKTIALLGVRNNTVPVFTSNPPRDDVEKKLAKIWTTLLPGKNFGVHDDFFDLGGHSLLGVQLFSQVERSFKIRLPLVTLFQASTIAQLANVLREKKEGIQHDTIIVPINRGDGNKPILFGVHGHLGGILFWRSIVAKLPSDQPFYAIQAQGVEGMSPALTRIEEMATLYIREMQNVQPKGPYYLCGFSMGGEICYEIAQQLVRLGDRVRLLVMLDTRNPERLEKFGWVHGAPQTEPNEVDSDGQRSQPTGVFKRTWWHIHHMTSMNMAGKLEYLWMILKAKFTRPALFRLVKIYHTNKLRLPDSILSMYLRAVHSKALHDYIPVPYLGKVTLFRSSQTEEKSSEDVPWSWKALARGGFEIYRFNATHNIISEEYAETVAQKLHECLIRAQGQ